MHKTEQEGLKYQKLYNWAHTLITSGVIKNMDKFPDIGLSKIDKVNQRPVTAECFAFQPAELHKNVPQLRGQT